MKAGRHPGHLETEAWNTEKLMRAYAARKKLESRGAMAFSWAETFNIMIIIYVLYISYTITQVLTTTNH